MTERRPKTWLMVTALLLVVFGLPAFLAWNFMVGPMLTWRDQYVQLIGKPEQEVIRVLGAPKYTLSPLQVKQNGIDFPWRDMHYQPVPERPVHKKVLLYADRAFSYRCSYIFIAADGRVEAIDFAGT